MEIPETTTQPLTIEEQFAAIDVVFPLAVSAYETMIKRVDAQDNRIQSIMTFAAAVTVAIPGIAAARSVSITSGWFIMAMILFVMGNIIGVYARVKGEIVVLSPAKIYEAGLDVSAIQLKIDTIDGSARHFQYNNNLIRERHSLMMFMLANFTLEVFFLSVWAARSTF